MDAIHRPYRVVQPSKDNMSLQEAPAPTKIGFGRKSNMITLTAAAAVKVKALLATESDPSLALRVAVRPGGCSGFSYEMFFDAEVAEDDIVKEFDGVKVISDPTSAGMLVGATLEYKDALSGGGFSIDNPNAQRTCGCGNSFS